VADRPTTDNGSTAVTAPQPDVGRRERPWHAPPPPSGPIAQVTELKDLVVAYAKQETVDPLKTLKRYLAFGLSGALSIGVGLSFGLLALLRGLEEFDIFNDPASPEGGTWSFVPYLVTTLVGVILAVVFLHRLYRFTQKQGSAR